MFLSTGTRARRHCIRVFLSQAATIGTFPDVVLQIFEGAPWSADHWRIHIFLSWVTMIAYMQVFI